MSDAKNNPLEEAVDLLLSLANLATACGAGKSPQFEQNLKDMRDLKDHLRGPTKQRRKAKKQKQTDG